MIALESGPAWQVNSGASWFEAKTRPAWRKNKKRKNPVWPGKTRSQPVVFFFTKTTSF
jgi:hypothetical protein